MVATTGSLAKRSADDRLGGERTDVVKAPDMKKTLFWNSSVGCVRGGCRWRVFLGAGGWRACGRGGLGVLWVARRGRRRCVGGVCGVCCVVPWVGVLVVAALFVSGLVPFGLGLLAAGPVALLAVLRSCLSAASLARVVFGLVLSGFSP